MSAHPLTLGYSLSSDARALLVAYRSQTSAALTLPWFLLLLLWALPRDMSVGPSVPDHRDAIP